MKTIALLHSNPVNVLVADQPIRASRRSALWSIACIEQLWRVRAEKIAHAERKLATRSSDEPTAEEIGALADLPAERVEELKGMTRQPVSLDKPFGDGSGEATLADLLPDPAADSAFEQAATAVEREALREALGDLPPRERRVIELMHGLWGEQPRTLVETARAVGMTPERTRRVEGDCLRRLASLLEPEMAQRAA